MDTGVAGNQTAKKTCGEATSYIFVVMVIIVIAETTIIMIEIIFAK